MNSSALFFIIMKQPYLLFFLLISCFSTNPCEWYHNDNTTNDPLFGATIAYDGKGIISDFDGNFALVT